MLMATRGEDWAGIDEVCGDAERMLLRGTSCRTRTARATLRQVWPLRRHLGITRLADISELDYLGIPVIVASRPAVQDVQITTTQGKGVNYVDALASALLEAVERHAASRRQPTLLATVAQLEALGRAYLPPEALNAAPVGEHPIEWIAATSLRTGQEVLVPAADVLYPYFAPPGAVRPMRPSTTGLASGNTTAEAILHALFEVIERDAVSCHQLGAGAKLLDLDSLPDGSPERWLCDRFKQAGVELFVLDMSETSLAATFRAITIDHSPRGPRLMVGGQGAHIYPQVALRRALAEAAQSRAVAIQASREDLVRHADNWNPQFNVGLRARLLREMARREGVTALKTTNPNEGDSIASLLRQMCRRVAAAGFADVVYTNLTDPRIGIPTLHVLVPGMMDVVVEPNRRRDVRGS